MRLCRGRLNPHTTLLARHRASERRVPLVGGEVGRNAGVADVSALVAEVIDADVLLPDEPAGVDRALHARHADMRLALPVTLPRPAHVSAPFEATAASRCAGRRRAERPSSG